jgi:hypothetical protein
MGKDTNQGFGDRFKAGISKAKDNAEKVAKSGLAAAKEGFEVVADGAEKAAKASGHSIKETAEKVADKATDAKHFTDAQLRAGLDKAYQAKRQAHVENLARLRKKNPKANPSRILDILEKELHAAETKSGSDSSKYIEAATLYSLTAVEVYGEHVKDSEAKQRLIDWVVLLDSKATKGIVEFGGLAVTLIAGRIGVVGKAVKAVSKVTDKISWLSPLVEMAGIKNPGKQSASWLIISATKGVMGNPPDSWPADENEQPEEKHSKSK